MVEKLHIGVSTRMDDFSSRVKWLSGMKTVWAKLMEWKYPVRVVVTGPAAFKGAGAVEAAASL